MIKILHITPNFNYNCGRSKLTFLYLKYFNNHNNYETHFITNTGDSLDRLKKLPNVKNNLFNFSTGYKNILHWLSFYKNLKKYVIVNKINLIHTHHRFPESISVRIGKELNIKTVTSSHSFVVGFKNSSFKSDKIISVSNSIRNYLLTNFEIEKEKIATIYNPTEKVGRMDLLLNTNFKVKNNILTEHKLILYVGRITKDKGYDTLLKSFLIVLEKVKNVILIITGENDDKRFKLNSIKGNIIYIPPQKDINLLYYNADIVVLPSRVEPFGNAMIEAGSFKKAFIGGNTGGIAEFIEDGENGLLVDPENPEQLAEKIIYLLNNPDIRKMLGENLYEKVNRLCDYNNYFSEVDKIYNSLLGIE